MDISSVECMTLIVILCCGPSVSQRNLSPLGIATQSSTYPNCPAKLAITGGPTNNFNGGSCSHTGEWRDAAWWMLTLPNDTLFIEQVTIYYRGDSNGIDGFSLYMSNTSISGTNKQTPPGHLCYQDVADGKYSVNQTIYCSQMVQYVILYNDHPKLFTGPFLELCDVQVIGCSKKWFGNNCREKCSMKCLEQHCYPSNGSCVLGCIKGFGGQYCNGSNLAVSGLPSQYPEDNAYPAELAIDGIRIGNVCSKTSGSLAWWLIDLKKISVVETIFLSFQNNDTVKQYATNHSLYISNSSVTWRDEPILRLTLDFDNNFPFITYSIYPAKVGRYIFYEPKSIEGNSHVDICEVEIVGCQCGFYGQNCSKTCPENCSGPCHPTTGFCFLGCKDGWMNPHCNKSCNGSTFGHGCKNTCHCYNETMCHHITGKCPTGGCQKGWVGPTCSKACEIGRFGYNCNEFCEGCWSKNCARIDGRCNNTHGCNPGWFTDLPFCQKVCPLGTFGKNCTHTCRCRESIFCNRVEGICAGECEKGWKGQNCSTECTQGTFGFSCKNTCNRCRNNTCNRFNGSCSYGCAEGYSNCEYIALEQVENSPLSIGVTVGVIVVAIVVIAIIFLIIRQRLRREPKKNNKSIRNTLCDNVYTHDVTDETDKQVGNPHVNTASIASTSGLNTQNPRKSINDSNEKEKHIYCNRDDNIYGNAVCDQKYHKHNIAIDDLAMFIDEKHKEKGFETEFESLPKGHVYEHTEGIKEENKLKNRFLTTWPYDHSRVILTDNPSSDYINASYIDNYSKDKAYVATQGPKRNTIRDFWEMIWQEKVKVIVMVTQLVESGRKKCEQYWPDLNDKRLLVGNLKISTCQERTRAVYVERVFTLLNKKVHTERTIRQFHFTQWPDHGVPDIIKLVNFYRKVKQEIYLSDVPLVVHCSAGIGRTGTFLAIDALYEHGQRTGFINVMEYAQMMRKDRINMIQTKEQYQTVFEALLELFTIPDSAFGRNEITNILTEDHPIPKNQTKLYLDFQRLQTLKPNYSRASYSRASAGENILKNSNDILAHDKYRPILMSNSKDRNDYINAVILPEYNTQNRIIVTQYPTGDTLVDFWTMIYDHNCPVVVLLKKPSDNTPLWPRTNSSMQLDTFVVETKLEGSEVDIRLTHKPNRDDKQVTVIQMNEWSPENLPTSSRFITDLLHKVSSAREKRVGSVAVVDEDGASWSGLFVALTLVLQKLDMDDEVDIFQVVRMIQTRRPEFFTNFDQYEYCYQFLQEYLDGDSLYANT